MNEKLLLELIKIIKQSKKHILKVFEDTSRQSTYVNFDTVFDNIEKYTKVLANTIKKEANTFNKDYDSEEQMIKEVENSFENINKPLQELTSIYNGIKHYSSFDNMQQILSFKVIEKILNDYIIWCEKLENALIGIGSDEVIFMPNTKLESEIISFIVENSSDNSLDCWVPFLGGMGLGFLLDSE